MNTLAWILIMIAVLLIRQVSKGRVMNLGEDLSDAFIAIASGDQKAFGEVLAREGEANSFSQAVDGLANASADAAGGVATGIPQAVGSLTDQFGDHLSDVQKEINRDIALWAVKLGSAAKGYRWTATGPDYYDCSGLMYRACQKARGYKGARFTTYTIQAHKEFVKVSGGDPSLGVSQATQGDIVLWPGKHMGVVTTGGKFYSARNSRVGIGEATIAGYVKGVAPVFLRYVN